MFSRTWAGTSNRYWVILTNAAHTTPGVVSSNIYLTVLADSDGDGMDDPWELDNGLHQQRYRRMPPRTTMATAMQRTRNTRPAPIPADANSYLKVDRIAVTGEARIEFRAAANKTYTVQYKRV